MTNAFENGVLVTVEIVNVHPPFACSGQTCIIHNPSDHNMSSWPTLWTERGTIDRLCEHGHPHPDPDDLAHRARHQGFTEREKADHEMSCDGCCLLL